jgi:hypothetical protein
LQAPPNPHSTNCRPIDPPPTNCRLINPHPANCRLILSYQLLPYLANCHPIKPRIQGKKQPALHPRHFRCRDSQGQILALAFREKSQGVSSSLGSGRLRGQDHFVQGPPYPPTCTRAFIGSQFAG